MNAFVVGADRLGNIPAALADLGIRISHHVSGREVAHQRHSSALPQGTDVLILFTDFLGHNVMQRFRASARERKIPVVACRRSVSCLVQALVRMLGLKQPSASCQDCPLQRSANS